MREAVVNVLHTKEGSRVALHCLWHGTPKVHVTIQGSSVVQSALFLPMLVP